MAKRTVLILTGEPSGDVVGGKLARALRELDATCRIVAVGGPKLREAGAEIVCDIAALGAMGFVAILRQIPRLSALERELETRFERDRPDVVVPIDYPGFNLRIARRARAHGIPVVYYVGPQVWAWGAKRIPRIAASVDHMLVVFPFEQDLYASVGLRTTFVGHPLLDDLETAPPREVLRARLGLADDVPLLGLLAGSRIQEVRRILPVMAKAAARIAARVPGLRVVASAASSVPAEEYAGIAREVGGAIEFLPGPAAPIITASDALLVTSGTATLESGLLGTPLAVLYRTSPVEYRIGRTLVKIPRISLANIVAGEDVAPEFLQGDADPERIADWATHVLTDPGEARRIRGRLGLLREKLGEPGASRRAAELVLAEANRS
ncbi:MAG: lipid-A-disaccharide synthase [bacterium]